MSGCSVKCMQSVCNVLESTESGFCLGLSLWTGLCTCMVQRDLFQLKAHSIDQCWREYELISRF